MPIADVIAAAGLKQGSGDAVCRGCGVRKVSRGGARAASTARSAPSHRSNPRTTTTGTTPRLASMRQFGVSAEPGRGQSPEGCPATTPSASSRPARTACCERSARPPGGAASVCCSSMICCIAHIGRAPKAPRSKRPTGNTGRWSNARSPGSPGETGECPTEAWRRTTPGSTTASPRTSADCSRWA
jgi:hypothetical protein